MNEQRRDDRISLYYHLKVIDPKTKHQIGHLADVSANGCQIVVDHPLKENRTMQLAIEDTLNIESGKPLAFVANCRWCKSSSKKTIVQSSYDVGMEFQHLPPKMKKFVESFH